MKRRSFYLQCIFALLTLFQSCAPSGPDISLPIWGVWNPGDGNQGPFRNVKTEMGLFKSPSDNPVIIQSKEGGGPSIFVQGQLLMIKSIEGTFPKYLLKVVPAGHEEKRGQLGIEFINQDRLKFEKIDKAYFVLDRADSFFSRAEKLSAPIDETEYHAGE